MKHIFSGVQPTGSLHLGNYLGAIKQWVGLQDEGDAMFCIVDLHAITVRQDPDALRASVLKTAATYLACGIDPARSNIFVQSHISGHSELAWMLSCFTPLGWLNRMTQFKEKAGKKREEAVLGLYSYPVLMAADILLYRTTHVPVGDDQKQHLELARDIAGAVNREYNGEIFPLPEPVIMGGMTRVMSLKNGRNKMSKSDPSAYSRIELSDDADTIAQKVKKAKSDMHQGITYDIEERPEASNLLGIYAALEGVSIDAAQEKFASHGFADFKRELADILIAHITPIGQRAAHFLEDRAELERILKRGAEHARTVAQQTITDIKRNIGLI